MPNITRDLVKKVDAVLIQRKCRPMPLRFEGSGRDRRVVQWEPDHSFYCVSGKTTRPPKDAKPWCGVPFETTVRYLNA